MRNLRIQSDVNGFSIGGSITPGSVDAIEALKMVDELYRVLVNQSDYAPARKPTHKANLASTEDSKLEQDRSGSGSGGTNGNGRQ